MVYPEILGFVKSYGLMLSISFLLGIWLSLRRGQGRGIPGATILDICFAVMVSSLVGVRLFYVLTHLEQYRQVYKVFYLWDGGLTLYGGILLAIVAVWWLARRRRIPFLRVADVLAPGVMLGIGITRVGCFLAGCCYGKPTDLPWGVHFPATCRATAQFGESALHPTQLYSSLTGFFVFALLMLRDRRPGPDGALFGLFLVLYGLARFSLEFLRFIEVAQRWALGLSNNQWLSLGLVCAGAVILLRSRPRAEPGHG